MNTIKIWTTKIWTTFNNFPGCFFSLKMSNTSSSYQMDSRIVAWLCCLMYSLLKVENWKIIKLTNIDCLILHSSLEIKNINLVVLNHWCYTHPNKSEYKFWGEVLVTMENIIVQVWIQHQVVKSSIREASCNELRSTCDHA